MSMGVIAVRITPIALYPQPLPIGHHHFRSVRANVVAAAVSQTQWLRMIPGSPRPARLPFPCSTGRVSTPVVIAFFVSTAKP
jgi:hypothetical protein